jgi:DnaJ-class molecular chaperone
MECPDCKGVGTKPRPEAKADAGAHWSVFPMLCDRCSGSGEVMAQVPKAEGQAVVAVP